MKYPTLWSVTFLLSVISTITLAETNVKAPKVTVAIAQPWAKGIQKPLYCRGDVPHRIRISSHVQAELNWVLPLSSDVKKGDILAKQDDFYLQQNLAQLQADIATQDAEYQYAFSEFNRLKALENQSLASKSELNQFERDYKTAAARKTSLQKQAQTVRYQIKHLTHYAQEDGEVLQLFVEPGEWITQGESIMVFLPAHHEEITCRVSLAVFNEFNQFAQASFHLADDTPLKLVRKASFVDREDQTFTVHFGFADQRPDTVFLGQRFTVMLREQADDLVAVPYDALTLEQDQTFVWQIDAQNKAHKQRVKVVDTHSDYAVIRSQITSTQRVVLKGKQALQEDVVVQVNRNVSTLAAHQSSQGSQKE